MPDERIRQVRGFWQRRRERMVAEVRRNRAGGHRVPTWVLVLAVVAMLAAWAAVILLAQNTN